MRALKRKKIIEIWQQNIKDLESYCCPECKNILVENASGNLECETMHCYNAFRNEYDIETGAQL